MEEILKVLVVDDDEVDRMAVRRALRQSAGMHVELVEAESYAAAMAALQQQDFDCVFLDYRLPDGDGVSLIEEIRALDIKVALVGLTGQGDEEIAVSLMKAGASDYLSKSRVSPETLSHCLRNAIRLHRAEIEAIQANRRLRESEERYRLVVEGSNDGIWDWNLLSNTIYCNDRFFEILGLSRLDFTPTYENLLDLVHPEDRAKVLLALNAHLEQGTEYNIELQVYHASGHYRYCIIKGKAQMNALGKPYRMSGSVSDITERKQTEATLRQRFDQLQVIYQMTDAVSRAGALQEIYQVALQGLLQILKVDRASVLLFDPDGVMRFKAWLGLSETYRQQVEGHTPWLPETQNPSPIFVVDVATELGEPLRSVALQEGVQAMGFIPLVYQGRLLGKFMLYANAPREFTDEEVQVVQTIVSHVAFAIERKRTEEALRTSEAAQRFLVEASTLLTASLEVQTALETLSRLAVPRMADWCAITLQQASGRLDRVIFAHVDPSQEAVLQKLWQDLPTPQHAPLSIAKVLRTGESEFYPEVTDAELLAVVADVRQYELLDSVKPRSYLCVPLVARGHILGVMSFVLCEASPRRYSPEDLALAEDLARRAALAVDNARLYQEAQDVSENLRQAILTLGEQQQQLRTLQRLTNLLNQRLADLPGLLQTIVRSVCRALPPAQFGLIALRNADRSRLELTAKAGMGIEKLQMEGFDIRDGLLGQVFLTGESLLMQDDGSTSVIQPHWSSATTGTLEAPEKIDFPASIYAVAIESAQAGRLGVLAIGNWNNSAAFDEEDQRLLVAFGEQAAIALNNAQLIKTLEEREERLADQNTMLLNQNLELERQRHQIQLQNLQLVKAAQMKSQFLATMSHELRTPMNAIIGFSQLLLRQNQQDFTPRQSDMLERILNNGKNLLNLINDILDLSKIEAGRLELKPEELDLVTLVTATAEELRSLAEQKNLDLKLNIQLRDSQVVNDSNRLRQVLVNLLSNAIKFTEVGRVQVDVWELEDGQIAIAVKDTGIGISQADLPFIFEEFRQLDQSLSKRYAGTGLGLAITDWLVRMMQGAIAVESQLGQGSTFTVQIPRWIEAKTESVTVAPHKLA